MGKGKKQRSDIPYIELMIAREIAEIAMQVACVALNNTEGLGHSRLDLFVKEGDKLLDAGGKDESN